MTEPQTDHSAAIPDSRTQLRTGSTSHVLGLPLAAVTFREALRAVDRRVREGRPGFWVTANLNYAMLTSQMESLKDVNQRAAMVLADGMPLVWASRMTDCRLPERVTGADLTTAICQRAAERGYRVFLLGAASGVARQAASQLREDYPGIRIAGTESPPFRPLSAAENTELINRIRAANPDVLLVAFGQPRGEIWLAENIDRLQVPLAMQIGASIDFVAGTSRRAPRLIQKCGLEWAFRLLQEPRRLCGRYAANALFLLKAAFRPPGPSAVHDATFSNGDSPTAGKSI